MSSIRVLNVIWSLGAANGGTTEACLKISKSLVDRGHVVSHAVLDGGAPELPSGCGVVAACFSGLGKFAFSVGFIRWLRSSAVGYDVVLVHGVWQFCSVGVMLALLGRKVPFIVVPHGGLGSWFNEVSRLKHLKKLFYWFLVEYWVIRRCSRVIYASQGEFSDGSRSFPMPRGTCAEVVHFGTEDFFVAPVSKEYYFQRFPELRGKLLILSVGRLHPVKGGDILLKAFASTFGGNSDVRLVFVGPVVDESWFFHLKSLATQLGVEQSVQWLGMLRGELLQSAYSAADVVVLPSHHENMGMTALEAISVGAPLIITTGFKICELLRGENAAICCDSNVLSLRDALLSWLDMSDSKKHEMLSSQRSCYLHHFTLEAMGGNFERVIISSLSC